MTSLSDFLTEVKAEKEKKLSVAISSMAPFLEALKEERKPTEIPQEIVEETIAEEIIVTEEVLEDTAPIIEEYQEPEEIKEASPLPVIPQISVEQFTALQNELSDMKKFWSVLKLQLEKDMKKAMNSSGSGVASVIELDIPVKTITSQSYTVTKKDYYIGVNYDGVVDITLQSKPVYDGRQIVIKDESGHAQLTPIRIIGTIDGDPDGAEIRINYGSITLFYRNGWRII